MKHIFRKLHLGGNHDANRSNDSGPSTSTQSCATDHRNSPAWNSGVVPSSPSSTSSSPSTAGGITTAPSAPPASSGDERKATAAADFYSSEEEFQIQLALAISASNSDFRDEIDKDQIHAATMLSLGRPPEVSGGGEDAAAVQAARYWDYDVLDYDDRVLDGFYDIYGTSLSLMNQGKMPSLVELQGNLDDVGCEVIMVNRMMDSTLEDMEQVSRCIAIDCSVSKVGIPGSSLLVQRVANLVVEQMGGPVKDVNVMLTRWMDNSIDLRTSLQTSILPIGCINIGLSRHRALLFKILADNVGIPCRLVKGSHYTGIDDGAVNIIKAENEREFLVDLMGAPGTLIPADILGTKEPAADINDLRLVENTWSSSNSTVAVPSKKQYHSSSGESSNRSNEISHGNSLFGNMVPALALSGSSSKVGSSSTMQSLGDPFDVRAINRLPQSISSSSLTSTSRLAKSVEASQSHNGAKDKLNTVPHTQEPVDSSELFADLNPFQIVGSSKVSNQNVVLDKNFNDLQRRRENVASGPGRPLLPGTWKTRSNYNEIPRKKQQEFGEELFPRKNLPVEDFNSSSFASTNLSNGNSIDSPNFHASHFASRSSSSMANEVAESSSSDTTGQFGGSNLKTIGSEARDQDNDNYFRVDPQNSAGEHRGYDARDKRDKRKHRHERPMEDKLNLHPEKSPSSLVSGYPSKLDPMLDDVAECEIPWEHLVIGERIGLGSYGEVYHADWNGTEVAVKKFLDQDFSGDAIDEFRSEVRIMRRLRHPNVVLFMGAVTRPPNLSIVTEFLPRGSLYKILHRPSCQIDEKQRIRMALDVAKGMNCLHTSVPTIVHRDLKSPNLLVDNNWNVKVCDFGLSRMKHHTFLSSKSTAGTPEWMAPEVLRNEPSNEKCDVYSFGVILWELATMRIPWSGMNPMQVVGAVGFQNRRLEIPKEVDPLVARIIWECWQTDPSLRPSFAQLAEVLKPLQCLGLPSSVETPSTTTVPQELFVNSTP